MRLQRRRLAALAQRRDPKRGDLVAAFAQYLKAKAMEGEGLSALRDHLRLVDDETCHRGHFVIGQMPVVEPVQIAHGHDTVDDIGSAWLRPYTMDSDIVLVGNIADDFLDDIFKRHEPHDLTILVHHQSKMHLSS